VRFVPNRVEESEIKVGDPVLTSGTDRIFPPDLVVGKVARFARRPAEPEALVEVELFMDLSHVENCLVLKKMKGRG
jgi:cell shape-determining protein MreC